MLSREMTNPGGTSLLALVLAALTALSCAQFQSGNDGGPPGDPGTNAGAPTIVTFAASPTSITAGSPSTLSWELGTGSQGASLSIDQGIGAVSGTSVEVRPTVTTTYTLTATNSAGSARALATVIVGTSGGTSISGTLVTQTLLAAASPYRVTGDLTVPAGNRLTIEPGVRLVFAGRFKLAIRGRITAVGTAAAPITFTAETPSTGWKGMRLASNGDGAADQLEHCIFEYANKSGGNDGAGDEGPYSEVSGGAVWLSGRSNVSFNHNEVRFNRAPGHGGGMAIISPSGPATAVGNNFHDNECTGPRTQYQGVAGGVYLDHLPNAAAWTFRDGEFRNNKAAEGGAFYFWDSTATLDSIAMSGNTPQNWVAGEPGRLTVLNTPR